MSHVKTSFKPKPYSTLERQIELNNGSRKPKVPKARKPQEFKVDYRPPARNQSLKLTKEEIYDKVLLNIKSGMNINSNELAEMIWPHMTGRDPRWPTVHPYAGHVSMTLKKVQGAKRDRETGNWIIS